MSFRQQFHLTARLSIPAIISQLSNIVMQYIDASMVGQLGAADSASIGLVATTTWLFWGICTTVATGFSVQVAHHIGAGDNHAARSVLRQSLLAIFLFSLLVSAMGAWISHPLPGWLGSTGPINAKASRYFLIFILFVPAIQLKFLAESMLRSSGNMKVPSAINIVMCLLDVVLNYLLIFPTQSLELGGHVFSIPGAGLGISGAALGTGISYFLAACALFAYLFFKDPHLRLTQERGFFMPQRSTIKKAIRISLPMTVEHSVIVGAQIFITVIVTPLGIVALAANAFAITAESLCYMPGYGISEAATTLVGQSLGAGRPKLAKRFAYITVFLGMGVMTFMGAILYFTAPWIMGIMSPDLRIVELGVQVLRIEAFAEPMFAASIVAYGVFVGSGNTLIPSIMNFASIWAVRLTLAASLAPSLGLVGVWIAMCIELCFRGTIFLVRLFRGQWLQGIQGAKA